MSLSIWWVRRDLRLKDNPALNAALQSGGVLPVFILDPALLQSAAPNRRGFLFAGLRALDASLRARGSALTVRQGSPPDELARLMQESGAERIFAEEDASPYARRRDRAVASCLPLHLISDGSIQPAGAVHKPDGSPYTVFTPFARAWKSLPLPGTGSQPLPDRFAPVPALESLAIAEAPAPPEFPAGEAEALRRLEAFLAGPVFRYATDRDRMDLPGTSLLSPYFRFGMLSARRAAAEGMQAARRAPDAEAQHGAETWLNELIWRDFYLSILDHFPAVLKNAFQPALRAIPWRDAPAELDAWKAGQTGYPVVDAAMRQLAATGWMHNRARMITASFLSKDLLIDWQEGERWFLQNLVDGDPAANNGGWQWTAGVGTDAAPYFRIFNPILQGQKFDPLGAYIRRWVPELANVPEKYIHEPWRMPADLQNRIGCRINQEYPAPIVDHAAARERTLAAYRKSKEKGRGS